VPTSFLSVFHGSQVQRMSQDVNQIISGTCRLFGLLQKLRYHGFNKLRTLFPKHRGWGCPRKFAVCFQEFTNSSRVSRSTSQPCLSVSSPCSLCPQRHWPRGRAKHRPFLATDPWRPNPWKTRSTRFSRRSRTPNRLALLFWSAKMAAPFSSAATAFAICAASPKSTRTPISASPLSPSNSRLCPSCC